MVVGTKNVAMNQYHPGFIEQQYMRLVEQGYVVCVSEVFTEQEIPVSSHEKQSSGLPKPPQQLDDMPVFWCRVVVAQPDLKQVSQNIEIAGRNGPRLEKIRQRGRNRWPAGVEMAIGNEQMLVAHARVPLLLSTDTGYGDGFEWNVLMAAAVTGRDLGD